MNGEEVLEWSSEDVGSEAMSPSDKVQTVRKEIGELLTKQAEIANLLQEKYKICDELEAQCLSPQRPSSVDSGIAFEYSSTPSFMRSTKSSKSKAVDVRTQELPKPASRSGFTGPPKDCILRDTKASLLKKLPSRRQKEDVAAQGSSCDEWSASEAWMPDLGDNSEEVEPPLPKCADCESRATANDCRDCKKLYSSARRPFCTECYAQELASPALAEKIRLLNLDNAIAASEITGPLPFDTQLDYKERSELIAKEALWLALRAHWPAAQLARFPESPEQIRFGFGDLRHDGLGSSYYPHACLELCGKPRDAIWSRVLDMIDLRNSIAHRNNSSPSCLIKMMERALALVVEVGNEKLAVEVQGMIDEVRGLARASGAAILKNHSLALEGKDVKFPLHHQLFFEQNFFNDDLPLAVSQAAKHWKSTRQEVCQDDEDYCERVRKVKSWTYWKYVGETVEASSAYAEHVAGSEAEAMSMPLTGEVQRKEDSPCAAGAAESGAEAGSGADASASLTEWEAKEARKWPSSFEDMFSGMIEF